MSKLGRLVQTLPGALLVLAFSSSETRANAAPVVSNVTAVQVANTGQVRITYDVSDADGDQVTARVICSSDNGVNFDLLPVTVSGDANRPMAPGPGKVVIWDAGRDYPGRYWPQVVARVIVSDGPAASGEMVPIPAGTFQMGSDANCASALPVHSVTLSAFYIDKYEVTNAEFERFMNAGGYSTQAYWSAAGWAWRTGNAINQPAYWNSGSYSSGTSYPGFPVIGVSWYEAEAFANFVGKRLPTEAEWEWAARGNDGRSYPWGEGLTPAQANYGGNSDPYEPNPTPVGYFDGSTHTNPPFATSSGASPFGVHDMAGNAVEWVADWFDYYPGSPQTNPVGPPTGNYKILRGGSFLAVYGGPDACNYNGNLRTAFRHLSIGTGYNSGLPAFPDLRGPVSGFRCARSGP